MKRLLIVLLIWLIPSISNADTVPFEATFIKAPLSDSTELLCRKLGDTLLLSMGTTTTNSISSTFELNDGETLQCAIRAKRGTKFSSRTGWRVARYTAPIPPLTTPAGFKLKLTVVGGG